MKPTKRKRLAKAIETVFIWWPFCAMTYFGIFFLAYVARPIVWTWRKLTGQEW